MINMCCALQIQGNEREGGPQKFNNLGGGK